MQPEPEYTITRLHSEKSMFLPNAIADMQTWSEVALKIEFTTWNSCQQPPVTMVDIPIEELIPNSKDMLLDPGTIHGSIGHRESAFDFSI